MNTAIETIRATSTATISAPQLESVIAPVLQTLDSEHSRKAYRRALIEFITWWQGGGWEKSDDGTVDRAAIMTWRREMVDGGVWAPATVNQKLAAVKALVRELAARKMISWETVGAIASVKGVKDGGVRAGVWLTRVEVEKLLAAPNMGTVIGLRDAAMLRLILSGGLRRGDATRLYGNHLQLTGGRWALVDIVGKGGRVGTVPVAPWAADAIHAWQRVRGEWLGKLGGPYESLNNPQELPIFTRVPRGKITTSDVWGLVHTEPLTDKSVANVVLRYGAMIGRPDLAPHDLRRTFAQHAEQNGASIHQVQQSLRHASLATTTLYLGSGQNMQDAPCDYLRFDMPAVPGGGV